MSTAVDEVGPAEDGIENASEWGELVGKEAADSVKAKLGRVRGAALLASGPIALLLLLTFLQRLISGWLYQLAHSLG